MVTLLLLFGMFVLIQLVIFAGTTIMIVTPRFDALEVIVPYTGEIAIRRHVLGELQRVKLAVAAAAGAIHHTLLEETISHGVHEDL